MARRPRAQGVIKWLKEHRGAGWLTVSEAESDEVGGDGKKAPLAGCSMWVLLRAVSIEQHGWWQLSCAVRWEGSGGESRGRLGLSGAYREGRWVIREGPMHSYVPVLGHIASLVTFYGEDWPWSHCLVRRGGSGSQNNGDENLTRKVLASSAEAGMALRARKVWGVEGQNTPVLSFWCHLYVKEEGRAFSRGKLG